MALHMADQGFYNQNDTILIQLPAPVYILQGPHAPQAVVLETLESIYYTILYHTSKSRLLCNIPNTQGTIQNAPSQR